MIPLSKWKDNFRTSEIYTLFLFFSGNIFSKLIGLFRELYLAFNIDSVENLSIYLKTITVTDGILVFFTINSIQSVLFPVFSESLHRNPNISFYSIKKWCNKITVCVTIFTIVVGFITLNLHTNTEIIWVVFLSLTSGIVISNFIATVILYAKKQEKYAIKIEFYKDIFSIILLIISLNFFGIMGIIVSRMIPVIGANFLLWSKINTEQNTQQQNVVFINFKDYKKFIIGNTYSITFTLGRFMVSLANSNEIIYFHYSFLIFNLFYTSIVTPFSTIFIRRLKNDIMIYKKHLNKIYLLPLVGLIILLLISMLFKFEIINLENVKPNKIGNLDDALKIFLIIGVISILQYFITIILQPLLIFYDKYKVIDIIFSYLLFIILFLTIISMIVLNLNDFNVIIASWYMMVSSIFVGAGLIIIFMKVNK